MVGSCVYDPECTHLIPDEEGTRIGVTCIPITYFDTCNEMVGVGSLQPHCLAYVSCRIKDDNTH